MTGLERHVISEQLVVKTESWHDAHEDKTKKMTCAPSEDSDQPGHPPRLIRVFAVNSVGS